MRAVTSITSGRGNDLRRELKLRIKIALVIAIAAAFAAAGASWKWNGPAGHAKADYKIAGWSWGDDGAEVSLL
jgi:hypothetical protein